jgi:hypothetical protein
MTQLSDYECSLSLNIVKDDDVNNPSGNPGTIEIWDDTLTIATIHPAYGTPSNSTKDQIFKGGPTREEYAMLFSESYRMLKILEVIFTASHIENEEIYYEIQSLFKRLNLL